MSQETSSMSEFLLVPTNVQAFVVGIPGDAVYDLAPVPRTEDDVANWYVQGKYSFSFQNKLPSLKPGIHLHWALPAALTHSRHQDTEEPEQPCSPNRWLVLRMWHAAGHSSISLKGWVVESDYVSADGASGGTPFPFFGTDLPKVRYVGRATPVEGWSETHPEYRFELKSFGWGDPSFAAFYPACKGVLGFHDEMEEVAKGDLLTYLVIGWYSDSARDPLQSAGGPDSVEECKERLESLGWSCANLEGTVLPQRILCHGGVVGVEWQGANHKYPAVAVNAPATVAIGGSAAEALAALLAPGKKDLQQVLCAFQHGQATQVSESDLLGDLLHRHGFGAVSGGKLWSIEPAVRTADAQSSPPPMSAQVQNLLGKLNEAQQALDRQTRKVESLRSRLFACWAIWASKQTGPPRNRPNRAAVDSAMADFQKANDRLPQYEEAVRLCKTNVTAVLTAGKTGMQLAESTMPPFLHPKDPFVVLKADDLIGVDRGQRPDAGAEDLLPCRLANDVVVGASLSGAVQRLSRAEDCLKLPDMAGPPLLRDVMRMLALETLLFDPNCASLIKTEDSELLDPALLKALQQSLDKSRGPDSNGRTLTWNGQPPDPLGTTRWRGRNPWLPVYLMWQVRWRPAYAPVPGSDNSHSGALDGWQLDSDLLAGLRVTQGTAMKPGKEVLLEGVTIISVLSGAQLAKNLVDYAKTIEHNTGSLESLRRTQVLGQSLGGFNDLLLRQTLGLCLPPVDPTGERVEVDTSVWKAMGGAPQPVMPVNGSFLPVRAGELRIVNLCIVDAFGQTRRLVNSARSSASQTTVIASAALPPPQVGYHARFNPRLVQQTRLNFDWQPADADASGPVCGWIVANFLDKSFAVFSAGGAPLGVLESVLPALGEKTINSPVTFKWRPIPGTDLAIEGISNERLRRFLELVTRFTADEGQVFLELVDLVLRRTEAHVPAADPALAILLGRPLALAHASLGLGVEGLPAGYWKTDSEWGYTTEGFEKLRVPVQLGGMGLPADGLVGYLHDNDEPCFFASKGAVRHLSADLKIRYDQHLTVACADELPVSLTLLMDASARVHATTGILPRHHVSLPPEAARLAGLIEEVYFGVAPVLGERSRGSVSQLTMPKPSDAFGQWSWATRPDLTGQTRTWHEIQAADDRARFADNLALTEGWLRLRRNQDVAG